MEISFGGIKNLRIAEIKYSEFGRYYNQNKASNRAKLNYEDIFISCDLTDDEQGNHLSEFNETLKKSSPCYRSWCKNHENPNHFDLYMSNFKVKGDTVHTLHSNFEINGCDVMLDEPQALPLFSFMAKISKDIANNMDITKANKEKAKIVSTTIQDKVMEYINRR